MRLKSIAAGISLLIFANTLNAAPIIISGHIPKNSGCFGGNVVYVLNLDNVPYRVVYEISYTNSTAQKVKWTEQVDVAVQEQALVGCSTVQEYPHRFNASYRIISYTKL
ncbi:hypothetical protein [Acinetobacter haemolyticus]|uniref:hypothetical protein n=1 Tax=Acinetobacter haemolyticus TaxID=29430 RepID=UPI003F571BE1